MSLLSICNSLLNVIIMHKLFHLFPPPTLPTFFSFEKKVGEQLFSWNYIHWLNEVVHFGEQYTQCCSSEIQPLGSHAWAVDLYRCSDSHCTTASIPLPAQINRILQETKRFEFCMLPLWNSNLLHIYNST